MNKNWAWEFKKISRFLSTGHRLLPCCDYKVRETMVAKFELVLQGTSSVDLIHLIGPLKQYLADNISFQDLIAKCSGLRRLWPYQLTKPDFPDLRYFSEHVLSKTKTVTPIFFCLFGNIMSLPFGVASLKKKSVRGNFLGANVLNHGLNLSKIHTARQFCDFRSLLFLFRQSSTVKPVWAGTFVLSGNETSITTGNFCL